MNVTLTLVQTAQSVKMATTAFHVFAHVVITGHIVTDVTAMIYVDLALAG